MCEFSDAINSKSDVQFFKEDVLDVIGSWAEYWGCAREDDAYYQKMQEVISRMEVSNNQAEA